MISPAGVVQAVPPRWWRGGRPRSGARARVERVAVTKQIGHVELADDEPDESGVSFSIRRFARETFVAPPSRLPHRHNYQEIILVQSGRAWHTIDGQAREQFPGAIAPIAKGQVHRFERAEVVVGHVVRFTDDFLPAGFLSASWDYHATLFNHLGLTQRSGTCNTPTLPTRRSPPPSATATRSSSAAPSSG